MIKLYRNIAVVIILISFWFWRQWPDDKMHLVFCDVGQGDAILVVKGSTQMLIDTGPANGQVLGCLSRHIPFWDKEIDIVVITHDQSDHVGSLSEIKKHYALSNVYDANLMAKNALRYSNLYLDVLWPETKIENGQANSESVVSELHYGAFSALFTADIDASVELALLAGGVLDKVNVLKVAHHGSKFSSGENFLEYVKPDEAVVSVGKNNSYGHPAADVLSRFVTLKSRVWRTDKNGEVEFITDGKKYWAKSQR